MARGGREADFWLEQAKAGSGDAAKAVCLRIVEGEGEQKLDMDGSLWLELYSW